MIGMAAGMAQRGMNVFCYTIATFALYRSFEFIRDDLAYQNLPVTVVGIGGGLTYSTLGATHHAMEDVAVACAIPNMKVIAPCDPLETEAAVRWCAQNKAGPVYLRLGKAGEPDLTGGLEDSWEFGKIQYVRKAFSSEGTFCVLSFGPTVKTALEVADGLIERGHAASVVSISTLKPLDIKGLTSLLNIHSHIVVIEECSVPIVAERILAYGSKYGTSNRIYSFNLHDEFKHVYGSHEDLTRAHDFTTKQILESLDKEIGWTASERV